MRFCFESESIADVFALDEVRIVLSHGASCAGPRAVSERLGVLTNLNCMMGNERDDRKVEIE